MRLQARDHEAFYHLIYLLEEAGLSGVPAGGNELVVPDDAVVIDPELHAEMARVLVPGTAMVAFGPLGEGDSEPLSASGATGGPVPTQAGPEPNPAPAPMPASEDLGIMGPTSMQRPPRSGPGSSIQAQRRYALYLGLVPEPEAGRDEIIAQIDEHENADQEAPSDG